MVSSKYAVASITSATPARMAATFNSSNFCCVSVLKSLIRVWTNSLNSSLMSATTCARLRPFGTLCIARRPPYSCGKASCHGGASEYSQQLQRLFLLERFRPVAQLPAEIAYAGDGFSDGQSQGLSRVLQLSVFSGSAGEFLRCI